MSDFELQAQSIPASNRSASAQQKIDTATNTNTEQKYKAGVLVQMNPMKFPLEEQDRFQGHMTFQAIKVIPADISFSEKLRKELIEKSTSVISTRTSESISQKQLNDPEGSQAEALRSYTEQATLDKAKGAIIDPMKFEILDGHRVSMYLPTSFVVNDIVNYDNAELGITGAAGLQALQNTGSILGAASTALKTGVAGLKDIFAAGSSLSGVAARVAIARGSSFLPQTARDVLRSAAQVTVNPNVRAMFRGVALREFTFQFKLIPKSAQEAEEIKKIIKFFRYHAYPESVEAGGISLAYIFPSMFKIRLKYKNNQVGTRIKMCYLRNISTTYNPTSASFHSDGNPTEIDLTLSFVENTTLVRQDIDAVDRINIAEGGGTNYLDDGDGF